MDWIYSLLRWLDESPLRYEWIAWSVFAGTLASAIAVRQTAGPGIARRSNLIFASGIVLTLFAFRWPSWFVPTDFNPDEAQIVAGAITLKSFPIYWKYVDGTTHGPLCELPLVLAAWIGAPLNYVTARVVAALLQAVSLIGVWRTVGCLASERTARLAVIPGLAFWAFATTGEFVHYASELTGLTLLSVAVWAFARGMAAKGSGNAAVGWIFCSGVALGAVPFAKLQSVPQALALALVAGIILWQKPPSASTTRGKLVWSLIAGGLLVPAIIAAFLLMYGLVGQFRTSYILSGIDYANSGNRLREMPNRFFDFALSGYSFAWFLAGASAFVLLYLRPSQNVSGRLRLAFAAGWIQLAAALACVLLPGRESPHYLHLLIVPVSLLVGLILARASAEIENQADQTRRSMSLFAVFIGLTLVPQIVQRSSTPDFVGKFAQNRSTRSSAASFILERAKPTDTLAMWGWEPNLYVETGLPQGTREAHSALEIATTPLQAFYLSRYVGDLNRRQPAWFVDAVGPGGFMYFDRALYGHEMHARLKQSIADDYEFVGEFENKRIYHRRAQR